MAADTRVEIKAQLLDAQQRQLWSSAQEVRVGSGESIPLELGLPEDEGVYDIAITAEAERRLAAGPAAVVALEAGDRRTPRATCRHSRQPPALKSGGELSQILEIDPASSRWWEKIKLPPVAADSRGA